MNSNLKDIFVADFNGIYAQHAAMWTVYDSSIKMLLAVSSFPVLVAGVLVQTSQVRSIDFMNLPQILAWAFLVTPAVNFIVIAVIIHYRLDILFYARALNRYRAFYCHQLGFNPDPMPVDPRLPEPYEPTGPMGLIVHGSGVINSSYLILGLMTLLPTWISNVNNPVRLAVVDGIIYFILLEAWYWRSTRRPHLWAHVTRQPTNPVLATTPKQAADIDTATRHDSLPPASPPPHTPGPPSGPDKTAI